MRALAFFTCLVAAGCTTTAIVVGDGGISDGGAVDAHARPMRPPLDLSGCMTSCDCAPGQTCGAGVCLDGSVAVYCCSSEMCPSGAVCQAPDGEVSLCGGANP